MNRKSLVFATIALIIGLQEVAAQQIHLSGSWINETNQDRIEIKPTGEIILSEQGAGQIEFINHGGANVEVSGENFDCTYFLTPLGNSIFFLKLISKSGNCPSGKYSRIDAAPSAPATLPYPMPNGGQPPMTAPTPFQAGETPPRCIIYPGALPPGTPISSCDGSGQFNSPCTCNISSRVYPGSIGTIAFGPGIIPHRAR